MIPPLHSPRRGVTLIEITVVIAMIISLTSGLFFSASYFKESADQVSCISQISQMQKAMRSYQNFNQLRDGEDIAASDLIGADKVIPKELNCPHNSGVYNYAAQIPSFGQAFVTCQDYDAATGSVDPSQNHTPADTSGW